MGTHALAALLALPALVGVAAAPQADAPNSALTGRWESYTWDGWLSDESHRCQIATIRYRYYDIVRDAQGPRGTYFSVLYSLVFHADGACTVGGKTMRPLEMTVRSWALLGYGDTMPVRFSATAQGCTGLYCPMFTTKDFTSSVQRVGSGIEELDEDNPAWRQRYDPPEARTADQAAVRDLTERVRVAFATGDPAQVTPLLSAAIAPASRAALLGALPTMKEQYALIEGIEPIITFIADPGEKNTDPRVTRIAVMSGGLRRVDGSKAPVSMVFAKENGRWLFAGAN